MHDSNKLIKYGHVNIPQVEDDEKMESEICKDDADGCLNISCTCKRTERERESKGKTIPKTKKTDPRPQIDTISS